MTVKRSLIAGTLIICGILTGCDRNHDGIRPTETSISEWVYSSLTVQPDSLYQAHSAVSGIVEKQFVEAGDIVITGQPLLQISNISSRLGTENARLAAENARMEFEGSAALLKELKQEVEMARIKLINDSVTYHRQKRLWEQNVGSQQQYDIKKMNYELAKHNLLVAQTRYLRTKNNLEIQLRQSENTYEASLTDSREYQITSKLNGVVYSVLKNIGEIVLQQEPVASLGSADHFILEMQVDEADITRVDLDQDILITLDAFDDRVFEATVHKIYPSKDPRTQTFKVEGVFKHPPSPLYPGLSGEANILVNYKEGALVIPIDYLGSGNRVKTTHGWVKVELGVQNLEYVEILSGVDSTTYILMPE